MIDKQLPPPPSLSLGDIYYILFRHKWKILLISACGILLASLLPLIWSRPYESEAKLFIRYVLDTRAPGPVSANDPKVKSPDERGENIINTELEILTSLDLALEVATNTGPERILAKLGGGRDPYRAALAIRKGLFSEVPKKSNVIRIAFQHPDSTVVQPILTSLIDLYYKKHDEIHHSIGVYDDFLSRKTDELRAHLAATDEKLRMVKTNLHIISLEDSQKTFTEQMSKIQQDLFQAEAELAERQAAVSELTRLFHIETNSATLNFSTTNAIAKASPPTISSPQTTSDSHNPVVDSITNFPVSGSVPSDKLAEYKRVSNLLESLSKRDQDLLLQFTPENLLVKRVEEQIAEQQKLKEKLEAEFPVLIADKTAGTRPADSKGSSPSNPDPRFDLSAEIIRASALESRIKLLTNQLAQVGKEFSAVNAMEGTITELQRKKEYEERNYKVFSESLDQAGIDEALGPGRVSNISRVQVPSPPFRDNSKMLKVQGLLLFSAIAGAIALAFLLELYFDRSIKRPEEIERTLGLPLFLSIPRTNGHGKPGSLKRSPKLPLLTEKSEKLTSGVRNQTHSAEVGRGLRLAEHLVPLASLPLPLVNLRPFYETLRDRLISFFERKNLTHKPKLVGLTSCGEGAGVTSSAAGLASTLSETGDGNVLLVDMNLEQGAAHHFYKGRLECGLDDALEVHKRDSALVQDNLYVVAESTSGDQLPRVLPKRFKHLVPKLRASDYDYIIFDMPTVSQISATPTLARYMDMVFIVIESERTDRDVAKRAKELLAESQCNIGVILNKSRSYVPKLLQQEL